MAFGVIEMEHGRLFKLTTMKKLLLIPILFLFSFKTNEEKTAIVKLSVSQWQLIFNIMEQSNAPHVDVIKAEKLILEQVNKQLIDTSMKK